ncbi:Oidioi.mRNA.OKI2018_I69.chr1.g3422.t1.cds [Oikopleura dioica]|uniref:Oidioi.mRNA.OKI2018_I69.chr1.g3422.t1.cds n=1 Tax=Oikopleura dioica TaxID=34765 RepID=A0ABN7T387_OIKDI|nr:Oidioi.mRNA.OKI2018_I69.chr1.g3422.t1.cds [Oikopleura dioica]
MNRYDFIENQEFDFFGVENACRLEPCENGGTCVFAPGLEPPYGSLCEIDVDECALNPCRNGGQCSDRHNGFECTCEKGFAGKVCEIYEDPCDGFDCSLHGFCVADPFPNCICDPGKSPAPSNSHELTTFAKVSAANGVRSN